MDWIFRNEILAERDERLYVDFVDSDEESAWWTPACFDIGELDPNLSLATLVRSLAKCNIHSIKAIELLRGLWADFDPHDDTHWIEAARRNVNLVEQLQMLSIATPEFDDNDSERNNEH